MIPKEFIENFTIDLTIFYKSEMSPIIFCYYASRYQKFMRHYCIPSSKINTLFLQFFSNKVWVSEVFSLLERVLYFRNPFLVGLISTVGEIQTDYLLKKYTLLKFHIFRNWNPGTMFYVLLHKHSTWQQFLPTQLYEENRQE